MKVANVTIKLQTLIRHLEKNIRNMNVMQKSNPFCQFPASSLSRLLGFAPCTALGSNLSVTGIFILNYFSPLNIEYSPSYVFVFDIPFKIHVYKGKKKCSRKGKGDLMSLPPTLSSSVAKIQTPPHTDCLSMSCPFRLKEEEPQGCSEPPAPAVGSGVEAGVQALKLCQVVVVPQTCPSLCIGDKPPVQLPLWSQWYRK